MECGRCGEILAVPRGARTVQCARCCGVTRVERHGGMAGAIGFFVKDVIANIGGGGTRTQPQPQPQPPRLLAAGYPRVHGSKRAVLVGVKYTDSSFLNPLTGPIKDVDAMKFLLMHKYGFPNDCILVLTDEMCDQYRRPTKFNILLAMRWLVHGCSSGDSLVFHFSGHGGQADDVDGDELDGQDELICPLDSEEDNNTHNILDDEINEALVRPLMPGVKLHAIINACNSGTVLDLPNVCKMKWNGKHEWKDESPPTGASKNTSGGHAILISGSTDTQSSYEYDGAGDEQMVMEALTFSFFTATWLAPLPPTCCYKINTA